MDSNEYAPRQLGGILALCATFAAGALLWDVREPRGGAETHIRARVDARERSHRTAAGPTSSLRPRADARSDEPARAILVDADGRPSVLASASNATSPPGVNGASVADAARLHLLSVAATYGLSGRDMAALVYRDAFAPRAGAAQIVRFAQHVGTTPILGREVAVVMDHEKNLVAVTGRLAPSSVLVRGPLALARARVSSPDAVAAAQAHLAAGTLVEARTRAVLVEERGTLVPAHQVQLELAAVPPEDQHVVVFISAVDGSFLRAQRLAHADQVSFRVFGDPSFGEPWDSPLGNAATPHPTGIPSGFQPPSLPANLVTLQNFPFSRNDAWLPNGSTRLAGNAVVAYADHTAPDGYGVGDLDVGITAPNVFDYAYDTSFAPLDSVSQSSAATVQLFFTTSFLHDRYYDSGFDETRGNAQATNFGRGGLAGDRLVVEAQDHALRDRSLAIIPPDGQTPRLSFGLYEGPTAATTRDASLDATIVMHEWGHLLSERLVDDTLGLWNAQGRAIGEGTSDFVALLGIVRDEDRNMPGNNVYQGVYAIGGYVASATDTDGHYFGVRRAPYSTDLLKNALLLSHVARGAALPSSHTLRSTSTQANPLAHEAGELWGVALFETYVSLLNAYPFQEAQNRMQSYLVAALAAMPSAPTFAEARASLLAVAAASDPADHMRFAIALAKRGLGFGLAAPARTSTDLVGATPTFTTGNALRWVSLALDDSATGCDFDGVLDVGETGLLTVVVENVGVGALAPFLGNVTSNGATSMLQFPNGNTLSFPALATGGRATATIPVKLDGVSGSTPTAGITVTANEPSLAMANRITTYDERVHYDERFSGMTDTFSTRLSSMRIEHDGVTTALPASASSGGFVHLEDGPSRGTVALVTPPFTITSTLGVSYGMRHSFVLDEDGTTPLSGAVVEISEDGVHFVDVSEFADPAYDGALGASSPLGARPALVGMSSGFPSFVTTTLALGSSFVGKTVVLRFRIGSVGGERSAHGLDIDDLVVTGAADAALPTRDVETSDGTTCNQSPIANAGTDQAVPERTGDPMTGAATLVTLSALGSFEPDGQVASYSWTQLGGPAVVLATPTAATTTFVAPNVPNDAILVFRVTVSDGMESASDDVYVTVRHDDVAPVASLSAPATAGEGDVGIVLDGSASSDADGDALTFTFTQTSGPAVTLLVLDDVASFTAPSVTTDTSLEFSLVVSDGVLSSVASTATITILAAAEPLDAGVLDAGSAPDAGYVDAGTSGGDDAGSEPVADAGITPRERGGGGGCVASGSGSSGGASVVWMALLAAAVLRRGRRRV